MARPYKGVQVTEKKNAKKNILLLACELFVYICIELSTNLNALTMKKQNKLSQAIDKYFIPVWIATFALSTLGILIYIAIK